MAHKNFEEFLQDKFANEYHGIDDDLPDNFNAWLEMDIEQMIKFADEYAEGIKLKAAETEVKLNLVR